METSKIKNPENWEEELNLIGEKLGWAEISPSAFAIIKFFIFKHKAIWESQAREELLKKILEDSEPTNEDVRENLSKEDEKRLKDIIIYHKYEENWGRVLNSFTLKELLYFMVEDFVKKGELIKTSDGKYIEPIKS